MTTNGSPVAGSSLTAKEMLAYLRDNILRPCRNPLSVFLYATHVLHRASLSEADRASITEQAVMAALDCGQDEKAAGLILGLQKKFGPKSLRVRRLRCMALEAAGHGAKARAEYEAILAEHPTEAFCVRRLCSMHRAEGNYKGAIEVLKNRKVFVDKKENVEYTYAELYPMDETAAREIISLNWILGNVAECIRYADEVIIFDPTNFLHYNRLAEFCACAGQLERSATAYAHSLRLNDAKNNVRALYGLWHVANKLASAKHKSTSAGASPATDAAALVEFCETRLRAVYAGKATSSYLDLTLKSQS